MFIILLNVLVPINIKKYDVFGEKYKEFYYFKNYTSSVGLHVFIYKIKIVLNNQTFVKITFIIVIKIALFC